MFWKSCQGRGRGREWGQGSRCGPGEWACGLDQALPRGAFALAAPCPLPVLAQAKAETTSLGGPAACPAGGAGHMRDWERNPALIQASFLLELSSTLAHQLGQSHSNFYLKNWLFPGRSLSSLFTHPASNWRSFLKLDIAFARPRLSQTAPLPSSFLIVHAKHLTLEISFSAESFQTLSFNNVWNERNGKGPAICLYKNCIGLTKGK